jgi:hypothetical protein
MENNIDSFKLYAATLVQLHVEQLKEKYNHIDLPVRSRLELFNSHLDILKNDLHKKIQEILRALGSEDLASYSYIETTLWECYHEVINKFFRINIDSGIA